VLAVCWWAAFSGAGASYLYRHSKIYVPLSPSLVSSSFRPLVPENVSHAKSLWSARTHTVIAVNAVHRPYEPMRRQNEGAEVTIFVRLSLYILQQSCLHFTLCSACCINRLNFAPFWKRFRGNFYFVRTVGLRTMRQCAMQTHYSFFLKLCAYKTDWIYTALQ